MPAEQDPNEFESMPPGYRHLTQGEFDRLKRAQTPSRKLSEVRELLELKRKLDERDKELAETRQELAKARNQFLAMVAIAALIPVFMFMYYLLVIRCPAPHW